MKRFLALFILFFWGCGGGDSSDSNNPEDGSDRPSTGDDADIGPARGDMGAMIFTGAPQCSDDADNDGDGLVDLDDPGCDNALDDDERERACADGQDNDEDGLIDYPSDPGCAAPDDDSEANPPQPPECADGIDNDRNGFTDEQDPGCASAADLVERGNGERAQCFDRIDNDADGIIDFPMEPGCSAAGDDDEEDPRGVPLCSNGSDDDMDGRTDYPSDPGCFGRGDRDETDKPVTPACADGVDNDRDGHIDFPDDDGCIAASDSSEKGSCLDRYDPPRVTEGESVILDTSRGIFRSEGTCGGTGSPEIVLVYRLEREVDALVISTNNMGTTTPTTLYVRYAECLAEDQEVGCRTEVHNTANPGQVLEIERPASGDYFIFVDGVAGAGGPVELMVTETPLAQCLNGEDDDADGLNDYPSDPGCERPSDRDETDPVEPSVCSNTVDDDGDGEIDFPADVGCIAASWGSENDLCGAGVAIQEYPYGQVSVEGNTGGPEATNALEPNGVSCGRSDKPEVIFFYRNPYQSRLTISTNHPETQANTAVYFRPECTNGRSELACNDGSDAAPNRGEFTVQSVAPGNYFIVVDTSIGIGGRFKLTVISEYDETECQDHIDNDEDGRIDDDDPGCSSERDRSEDQPFGNPACNNGVDDDGDGRIDWPLDPGCKARGDETEEDPDPLPACANGVDDDGDGLIDIPSDPGCTSRGDSDETDLRIAPACANGRDDDRDGLVDYGEDPDCDFAGDRTE